MPSAEAPAFERDIQARGYVERPNVSDRELRPGEYTKRQGTSNPNDFNGTPIVIFSIKR